MSNGVHFFEYIASPTPWAILTAIIGWLGAMFVYRDKKKFLGEKKADRLEVHRDELALKLLQSARSEMASARVEVEDLREEVRKLRAMEQHFYHFQQSLDHLEALLFSTTQDERESAKRNAQAFLTRMRRLNEAKGTLANEAQRVASGIAMMGDTNKKESGRGG